MVGGTISFKDSPVYAATSNSEKFGSITQGLPFVYGTAGPKTDHSTKMKNKFRRTTVSATDTGVCAENKAVKIKRPGDPFVQTTRTKPDHKISS